MIDTDKTRKRYALKALSLSTAISSAGSQMTLIALSADILHTSQQSGMAALPQTISYLGAAVIGMVGGYITQRWTAVTIGKWTPFYAGLISLFLFFNYSTPAYLGLTCIFLIFLLAGLEGPNLLSFLNSNLSQENKFRSFSSIQSINTFANLSAPALAGFIATRFGSKLCYFIDALTYLFTFLAWTNYARFFPVRSHTQPRHARWLHGYELILRNRELIKLNASRLFNNIAYVSFGTAIPIWICRSVKPDNYSQSLGIAYSALSAGFLLSSLGGATGMWNTKNLKLIVCLVPIIGCAGVLMASPFNDPLAIASAAVLVGFGQFFFRISGITIGQYYSPKESLASIIIAGDTVVRLFSTAISTLTIFLIIDFPLKKMDISFSLLTFVCVAFLSIPLLLPLAREMNVGCERI